MLPHFEPPPRTVFHSFGAAGFWIAQKFEGSMQDINRQRTFLQGPQAEPLFESTDAAVHHSQLVINKVTDSTLWKFNLAGLI